MDRPFQIDLKRSKIDQLNVGDQTHHYKVNAENGSHLHFYPSANTESLNKGVLLDGLQKQQITIAITRISKMPGGIPSSEVFDYLNRVHGISGLSLPICMSFESLCSILQELEVHLIEQHESALRAELIEKIQALADGGGFSQELHAEMFKCFGSDQFDGLEKDTLLEILAYAQCLHEDYQIPAHLARICPQCSRKTWMDTKLCIRCDFDLAGYDHQRWLARSRELKNKRILSIYGVGFALLGVGYILPNPFSLWIMLSGGFCLFVASAASRD
jgi:hypothetical protein